jgi:hypothetical protein
MGREHLVPDDPRTPPAPHAPDEDGPHVDAEPDEAVGDFGDDEQSDAGGDSDPR